MTYSGEPDGQHGPLTLVQQFASALKLNIQFHTLFPLASRNLTFHPKVTLD